MVLSVGPSVMRTLPDITAKSELEISTGTLPSLRGAKTAISGGPVLVRGGKALRIRHTGDDYESSTALERHPRSAVGWNDDAYLLVSVDGRQRRSVGMTLNELAAYMAKLGCTDAMNLDGGGSAMLWEEGQVRNHPCDGHERAIANSLIVVEKNRAAANDGRTGGVPTGRASP